MIINIPDWITTKYSVDDLKEIDDGYYLLLDNNVDTAITDVMLLNDYFKSAKELCNDFPTIGIKKKDISFTMNKKSSDYRNYSFLTFKFYTPTNKNSKFPITLHYIINVNSNFGTIDYLANGQIGKASCIIWENDTCYTLNLSVINGELGINNIQCLDSDTQKQEKLYSYK